jgi:hypothetical protein
MTLAAVDHRLETWLSGGTASCADEVRWSHHHGKGSYKDAITKLPWPGGSRPSSKALDMVAPELRRL